MNMFATLAGMDGLRRVPVIGRGDANGVEILPFEHVAVIAVRLGFCARLLERAGQAIFVHVADRRHVGPAPLHEGDHAVEVEPAHAAHADVAEGQAFARAERAGGDEGGKAQGGGSEGEGACFEKITTGQTKGGVTHGRTIDLLTGTGH